MTNPRKDTGTPCSALQINVAFHTDSDFNKLRHIEYIYADIDFHTD